MDNENVPEILRKEAETCNLTDTCYHVPLLLSVVKVVTNEERSI